MRLADMPIRRKLMAVILATSIVVMTLMIGAFVTYEVATIRRTTVRQATTLGEIVAANSTAALAFENQDDAREILAALSAERHIVAASLYDRSGHLFAKYPDSLPPSAFPSSPAAEGYRFGRSHMSGFQPVVQGGNKQLGTLYLEYDTGTIISEWIRATFGIGAALMALVLAVAYLLSRVLQRRIPQPILALAETPPAVSDRRDYSVRAKKLSHDEIGLLTDAFNHMLAQIQEFNQGMEQLVARRTSQLEAANKELEAFSYSVSHDLRAPLRHVDGFAALLANHVGTTLDEKGRHLLATISSSAKQMGRLIDDLLEFARAGRTELRIAAVDQDAVVAGVIRNGAFETKGRPIEWRIAPLPGVRADTAMLRQVWANLIQNAVKYSGKVEAPVIAIGSRPGGADGETVFYVKDNGVGFDMRYVDKLFGVFQRLHAAADFEGTGIGLANVRRIVARHGGRTWAEGAVGQGATFFFSLPPVDPVPSIPSNSPFRTLSKV
jgi:signal transduction histidine kinase